MAEVIIGNIDITIDDVVFYITNRDKMSVLDRNTLLDRIVNRYGEPMYRFLETLARRLGNDSDPGTF